MKRIFISFPYTHEDVNVTLDRVKRARQYSMKLLQEGYSVLSPALFGHDLVYQLGLNDAEQDMTFSKWEPLCYSYLDVSDEVHILKFEGWNKSTGVQGELTRATGYDIPVLFIDL